jgi:hypothetical protein
VSTARLRMTAVTIRRSRRAVLIYVAVITVLLGVSTPLALSAGVGRVSLFVSGDASRQPASALAGATLDGEAFVFASATGASKVEFWIDSAASGPADQVQSAPDGAGAPKGYAFDLMGRTNDTPNALSLADLGAGTHTITAWAESPSGKGRSVSATFTVAMPAKNVTSTATGEAGADSQQSGSGTGGGSQAKEPGPETTPTPTETPNPSATVEDSQPESGTSVDPCSADQLPGPLAEYPNARTTGVPEDMPLRQINGDYRTTKNGQVISGVEITGQLFIAHDNVTVTCSRIWGPTINGQGNFKMWLSTLGDPNGVAEGSALRYSNLTVRRVEILGTIDGIRAENNVDVRDSWIHDLYRTTDSTQSSGMTHNDCIQTSKGSGMVFIHNRLDAWSFTDGQTAGVNLGKTPYGDGAGYQTSAIMINSGAGNISDVLIKDNIIRGRASKYIFALSKAPYVTSGVRIIDNIMGVENRDYPQWFANSSDALVTGNVAVSP